VFTVEYSVRSAQTAVYSLLGLNRIVPPVFKGNHDPRIFLKAFEALHAISTSYSDATAEITEVSIRGLNTGVSGVCGEKILSSRTVR
jgi:myosin-crossreactive antigen